MRYLVLGMCVLAASPLSAQAPALTGADAHYQAGRWAEAAAAYEAVLRTDSTQAMAWYRLGRTRSEQGRHEDAIRALEAARRHRFTPPAVIQLAIARAQTALGQRDAALSTLEGMAQAGYRLATSITDDTAFTTLRSEARMQALLERIARNAAPCRYSEQARQFDFWIGTWDVYHPVTGVKLGENRIEEQLNGCMLVENWTAGLGGQGKSINFFDPNEKTWRQVWVADGFSATDYTAGEYRDRAMRFTGRSRSPQGAIVLQRLTFYNVAPDTVRQVFEASQDDG